MFECDPDIVLILEVHPGIFFSIAHYNFWNIEGGASYCYKKVCFEATIIRWKQTFTALPNIRHVSTIG